MRVQTAVATNQDAREVLRTLNFLDLLAQVNVEPLQLNAQNPEKEDENAQTHLADALEVARDFNMSADWMDLVTKIRPHTLSLPMQLYAIVFIYNIYTFPF
jgi:hypothetical protein